MSRPGIDPDEGRMPPGCGFLLAGAISVVMWAMIIATACAAL